MILYWWVGKRLYGNQMRNCSSQKHYISAHLRILENSHPICLIYDIWLSMCVNKTYMLDICIFFCWTRVNIVFVSVKIYFNSWEKVEIHYFCSCRRHLAAVFILADNLDIRWQDRELQMHNIVQTLCTYRPFPGKHVILYFPWCH